MARSNYGVPDTPTANQAILSARRNAAAAYNNVEEMQAVLRNASDTLGSARPTDENVPIANTRGVVGLGNDPFTANNQNGATASSAPQGAQLPLNPYQAAYRPFGTQMGLQTPQPAQMNMQPAPGFPGNMPWNQGFPANFAQHGYVNALNGNPEGFTYDNPQPAYGPGPEFYNHAANGYAAGSGTGSGSYQPINGTVQGLGYAQAPYPPVNGSFQGAGYGQVPYLPINGNVQGPGYGQAPHQPMNGNVQGLGYGPTYGQASLQPQSTQQWNGNEAGDQHEGEEGDADGRDGGSHGGHVNAGDRKIINGRLHEYVVDPIADYEGVPGEWIPVSVLYQQSCNAAAATAAVTTVAYGPTISVAQQAATSAANQAGAGPATTQPATGPTAAFNDMMTNSVHAPLQAPYPTPVQGVQHAPFQGALPTASATQAPTQAAGQAPAQPTHQPWPAVTVTGPIFGPGPGFERMAAADLLHHEVVEEEPTPVSPMTQLRMQNQALTVDLMRAWEENIKQRGLMREYQWQNNYFEEEAHLAIRKYSNILTQLINLELETGVPAS